MLIQVTARYSMGMLCTLELSLLMFAHGKTGSSLE